MHTNIPAYVHLSLSNVHRPSGLLKLDLLKRMDKLAGGVGSGGKNWDGFRVPKCFHQVFRSTGHVCDLGTSGMESEDLR